MKRQGREKYILIYLLACLALLLAACGPDTLNSENNLFGGGSAHTGAWQSIRIFPDGGGWALTYHALLHTNDSGKHWNVVTPWPVDPDTGAFAVGRTNFVNSHVAWLIQSGNTTYQQYGKTNTPQLARAYSTDDGGLTWQSGAIPDTASTYSDTKSGAGDISGAVKSLLSQGETRHQVSINNISAFDGRDAWISVSRIYIHTGGGQEEIKAEYNRIWHSSDRGKHWQLLVENKQPEAQSNTTLPGRWVYFLNGTTGIESGRMFSSFTVSSDSGKNWHDEALPTVNLDASALPNASQDIPVFFDARNGAVPVHMLVGEHYQLFYYITHDGARTWQASPLLDLPSYPQVSYADAQHWFILQKDKLYQSDNGGLHWTSMALQLPGKALVDFAFTSASEGWAIVRNIDIHDYKENAQDSTTSLLKTTDGGKTWQEVKYQLV